ncbi:hypothetical protein [Streptomyces katrae]|uniref:hypothetical protein n=1 Tax=Streptomyces katrae TaxID=68223 RepID=UPI0009A47F54|nr:hypothetical protein [Streptomyces katrae]
MLAALLADAFQDDALTCWAFPDPAERRRILPGFFRVFVELSRDHGEVLVSPGWDAVVLLFPPGGWEAVEARAEEVEQRLAGVLGQGPGAAALLAATRAQAAHHPRHRPHYYLPFAGVSPHAQRRGVLSDLVEELSARLDEQGHALYCEASSPGGEAVCRRNGFIPAGDPITLPDGPVLLPYWRDPQ